MDSIMTTRAFLNIGTTDRIVRFVVGCAVLSLAFVGPKTLWGYLGLIPIVTAFVGDCPIYYALGISSCRRALP